MARDNNGQILVSETVLQREVGSPFLAEALACLYAIRLGVHMSFSSVTVKGDTRSIIQKCNSAGFDRSKIWAVIFLYQEL